MYHLYSRYATEKLFATSRRDSARRRRTPLLEPRDRPRRQKNRARPHAQRDPLRQNHPRGLACRLASHPPAGGVRDGSGAAPEKSRMNPMHRETSIPPPGIARLPGRRETSGAAPSGNARPPPKSCIYPMSSGIGPQRRPMAAKRTDAGSSGRRQTPAGAGRKLSAAGSWSRNRCRAAGWLATA